MNKVYLIYLLTLIANTIDVLSYAICIVGVKTRKLAISSALFQVLMIISRGAVFIQAPLLGSIADDAVFYGNTDELAIIFRNVIFITSIGSLLGGIITPFFIEVFSIMSNSFERLGTIPKMISSIFLNLKTIPKRKIGLNKYNNPKDISFKDMPKGLIILNSFAISVYSVGLLSAIYAGALSPDDALTASQLSGMVVGGAAALFMTFIDPMVAVITDQTMEGKVSINYIKSLVYFLVIGDFIGTIISQILFIPLTNIIMWLARYM